MVDEKISKRILLLPIFSIILFAAFIFITLFYIANISEKELKKELFHILLNNKKEFSKEMVEDLEREIRLSLSNINKRIKNSLKEKIYEANTIINKVLQENPKMSLEEKKYIISQILGSLRFYNGRGYYFAYNYDTNITTLHPIKKFLGKDMSHFKDKRGVVLVKLYKKIIESSPKKEGYAFIYFAKPSNPNKEFPKIVFIKYIPELNWVIGTGEYIDDVKKEIQEEFIKEIHNRRYGKNGYFWVHKSDYTLIAHPYRKKDIGKNDENLTINGKKIVKLFVNKALKNPKGVFVEYEWYNPSTKELEHKISFVKYFSPFDWIIGTGVYINDIKRVVQQQNHHLKSVIQKILIVFGIATIVILIIVTIQAYILSSQTKKLFEIYKNDLENRIEKAVKESIEKDKMLQEQAKLAAMGEMIGAISHQWRQPLNALAINIQLLEEIFKDNELTKEEMEEITKKNLELIQFMSNTIDDFRNFFKKDENTKIFSAKKAIEDVLKLLSAQLKNHNITVDIQGDDFNINGYENRFKQVLLNIINNAKDAIDNQDEKFIKIHIDSKTKTISIKDNGPGIPQNIIDRIFEPYFTTKEQGTGLGLYISKMVLKQMGADITAKNNNGAEFIIKFK